METKVDIHKAGGVIIRDRKMLVERSKDKTHFIAPGGSIEPGETPKQALVRELMEEFQILVAEADLKEFGTFYAQAAGQEAKRLRMDVFMVQDWQGEPTPDNEVEEVAWIDSEHPDNMQIGSVFQHDVLPALKAQGLID